MSGKWLVLRVSHLSIQGAALWVCRQRWYICEGGGGGHPGHSAVKKGTVSWYLAKPHRRDGRAGEGNGLLLLIAVNQSQGAGNEDSYLGLREKLRTKTCSQNGALHMKGGVRPRRENRARIKDTSCSHSHSHRAHSLTHSLTHPTTHE
ncbi:hypothetical protein F4679DRAFT_69718 [Xylaria curta]|nr:hypothetical protein F4679DRAFT_69718 [Xylaria curta]